jgi:hypothetical protein
MNRIDLSDDAGADAAKSPTTPTIVDASEKWMDEATWASAKALQDARMLVGVNLSSVTL